MRSIKELSVHPNHPDHGLREPVGHGGGPGTRGGLLLREARLLTRSFERPSGLSGWQDDRPRRSPAPPSRSSWPEGSSPWSTSPSSGSRASRRTGTRRSCGARANSPLGNPQRLFHEPAILPQDLLLRLDLACIGAAVRSGRRLAESASLFVNVHGRTLEGLIRRDITSSSSSISLHIDPGRIVLEASESHARDGHPGARPPPDEPSRPGASHRAGRRRNGVPLARASALARTGFRQAGQAVHLGYRRGRKEAEARLGAVRDGAPSRSATGGGGGRRLPPTWRPSGA